MSGFFFASIVSLVALAIAAVAAYVALRAARVSESRLQVPRSLDLRVQSLEASAEDLRSTLEQLANRVKMMRVRNAVTHTDKSDTVPDPFKDPDAWRKAMNRKMAIPGSNKT